MTYEGTAYYFGGDECRPLLNFNRTLCETSYRDAEAFCECFCPSLLYLDAAPSCKAELMDFFLLGRRGLELSKRHAISTFCVIQLCEWFQLLADPRQPMDSVPYGGVPPKCRDLSLPFKGGQCNKIFKFSEPFNPCPWKVPVQEPNTLRCSSGHTC